MNLASLLADLYRRLRYTSTPPPDITQRLQAFLNETQRELLAMPGIEHLRDEVMAVTAFANQARSGLPPVVARIQGITDRLNNIKLQQVPLSDIRTMNPSQNFIGGYPYYYSVVGERQIQIQPAAATGLWAVSSSASDTSQKVYVETATTGGYSYRDTKSLNGTTRVQFGDVATRTDHTQVDKFYVGAASVGYISLYDAAVAGNELARIEPGLTYARYLTVEWCPIQTADVTEYVDYQREIFDLVNAFDEPLLPSDFHWVMVRGALVKEYEFLDDTRVVAAMSFYERGQMKLRSFVLNDGDRIASLRPVPLGWNRLGPRFPAEKGW